MSKNVDFRVGQASIVASADRADFHQPHDMLLNPHEFARIRILGIGHGAVGGLTLQPLFARGEHVIADNIGVGVEVAAQLAVEGSDVPDVNDGDTPGHASFSLLAAIRAHDGPTSSQTPSMIVSSETASSSRDAA